MQPLTYYRKVHVVEKFLKTRHEVAFLVLNLRQFRLHVRVRTECRILKYDLLNISYLNWAKNNTCIVLFVKKNLELNREKIRLQSDPIELKILIKLKL